MSHFKVLVYEDTRLPIMEYTTNVPPREGEWLEFNYESFRVNCVTHIITDNNLTAIAIEVSGPRAWSQSPYLTINKGD